jgi:hypothetical protein
MYDGGAISLGVVFSFSTCLAERAGQTFKAIVCQELHCASGLSVKNVTRCCDSVFGSGE